LIYHLQEETKLTSVFLLYVYGKYTSCFNTQIQALWKKQNDSSQLKLPLLLTGSLNDMSTIVQLCLDI